jgi:MFS family permease
MKPVSNDTPSRQNLVRRLMWFLLLVYVAEGVGQVGGLISQPLTYFLKTSLGWNADVVTEYLAILTFPWVIKPIYGIISDYVPLFGYRRKTWLFLANALAMGGYLWLVGLTSPGSIIVGLLLTAIGMAASSTLSGAVMVENGKTTGMTGRFVGQQWLWFSIAGIVTSLAGGWLCEYLSPTSAFHTAALITAFAPVGVMFGAWFLIHEERSTAKREPIRQSAKKLMPALRREAPYLLGGTALTVGAYFWYPESTVWAIAGVLTLWSFKVLKSKTLWLVAGFLAFWNFSPGFGTPLYYYMVNQLHFSQMFIGTLGMWGSIGSAAGAAMFMFWLHGRLDLKKLIYLSVVFGVFCHASFVLLAGETSAIVLSLLTAIAGQIASLTMLTLAANACPDDAEGFSYAALMSVFNLAAQGSAVIGSWMYVNTFHESLNPLIWVSAAFTALCFFLVPLLPKETLAPAKKDDQA